MAAGDDRKTRGKKSVVGVSSSSTACQTIRCPSTNLQYATRALWAASTLTVVAWLGRAVYRSHRPTTDLKTSTSEPSSTSSASALSSPTPTTTCSSTLKNMNISSQVCSTSSSHARSNSLSVCLSECNLYNKKLRHRGKHSASDFGINRKLICYFVLVINTDLHPIWGRALK